MNEADKLYHKNNMLNNITSVTNVINECRNLVLNDLKDLSDDKIRTLSYRLFDLYIDSNKFYDEVLKGII